MRIERLNGAASWLSRYCLSQRELRDQDLLCLLRASVDAIPMQFQRSTRTGK